MAKEALVFFKSSQLVDVMLKGLVHVAHDKCLGKMFPQCAIKGVLCHLLSFKSCQQEVNWATNIVM